MPQIIWNDDFVLNIASFDEHHKHLISLINATTGCLERGAPREEIDIVLNSLVYYAAYHFSAEETWMKEHGFPKREEHEQIHRNFSDTIGSLQRALAEGSPTVGTELSDYLNFWLIDHIVICDSQYATFAGTRKENVLMT